jgi:hypothetical protein
MAKEANPRFARAAAPGSRTPFAPNAERRRAGHTALGVIALLVALGIFLAWRDDFRFISRYNSPKEANICFARVVVPR